MESHAVRVFIIVIQHMQTILKIILISFLLGIVSAQTYAEDQPDINLMPYMWKVRNQGPTGTCYAFSAAYLADFLYGSKYRSSPLHVSAYDIALQYGVIDALSSDFDKKRFIPWTSYAPGMNGGQTFSALESIKDVGGFCLEDRFPDNSRSHLSYLYLLSLSIFKLFQQDVNYSQLINDLRDANTQAGQNAPLEKIFLGLIEGREQIKSENNRNKLVALLVTTCKQNYVRSTRGNTAYVCQRMAEGLVTTFKEVFNTQSSEVLIEAMKNVLLERNRSYNSFLESQDGTEYLSQDPHNKLGNINFSFNQLHTAQYLRPFIQGMEDIACSPRTPPPYGLSTSVSLINFIDRNPKEVDDIIDFINHKLAEGYPVAIGYHTLGLFQSAFRDLYEGVTKENDGHASVIVGRTYVDHQQYFTVLNSWGANWYPSQQVGGTAIDVLANANDKNVIAGRAGGLFAISEEDLRRRINSATTYTVDKSGNNSIPFLQKETQNTIASY